jgi:hypothetical protein
VATIRNASSGSGRWSASASFAGAVIQDSTFFRRNGLGVDRPDDRVGLGHQEGKEIVGRLALLDLADRGPTRPDHGDEGETAALVEGEQTDGLEPFGCSSFSAKLVNGTTHRLSTASHRRQCGDAMLRRLVTPQSELPPFKAKTVHGMPQRAIVSSRSPLSTLRTIGAK